ncbi:MAG: ABC transporter permease [Candidatus Brockarchaeota archaeon]|nr:ABC transporter permease [Candidatus Brockarchaeota archaeon]
MKKQYRTHLSFSSFSKRELKRFLIYVAKRLVAVLISVTVTCYLTILIAEMGGFVDIVVISQLKDEIRNMVRTSPEYASLSPQEQEEIMAIKLNVTIKERGLDTPFYIRSFIYLKNALILELGRANILVSDSGSRRVQAIIFERLPYTILLFTTATVLGFLINLLFGLYLSRHRGSLIDRIMVGLTFLSSIPGWFYGIIFIMIFAMYLGVLPYGGLVSIPPPSDPLHYTLDVLKHAILPIFSWLFAGFWLGVYGNRNFFLIFSTHGYVTVADAKGLPERRILTRYVIKPTLPTIITNLSLGIIGSWMGAMVTESVFNWPGIGSLTYKAINLKDTPIIVGTTVIYAYLLGLTMLVLDIIYSILDPRIRTGLSGGY